jgi:hypothetical protein
MIRAELLALALAFTAAGTQSDTIVAELASLPARLVDTVPLTVALRPRRREGHDDSDARLGPDLPPAPASLRVLVSSGCGEPVATAAP